MSREGARSPVLLGTGDNFRNVGVSSCGVDEIFLGWDWKIGDLRILAWTVYGPTICEV